MASHSTVAFFNINFALPPHLMGGIGMSSTSCECIYEQYKSNASHGGIGNKIAALTLPMKVTHERHEAQVL